jgi:LemA protein
LSPEDLRKNPISYGLFFLTCNPVSRTFDSPPSEFSSKTSPKGRKDMGSVSVFSVIIIVLGLIIMGLIGYIVSIFNSLVQVRNNVDKAFKNIDVLLQQRHDELPKLIDTCKAYMKYEKGMLDDIISLREHYVQAKTTDEKTTVENDLNKQMIAFFARAEAYPELKANNNFIQIQTRVSALESSIADRREFFNDSTNIFNIQIERFPHLILARILNYARKALLEVPEEKKQDVKMEFP